MAWAGDPRLVAGPAVRSYLEAVFAPGARLGVRYDDPLTPVEVVDVREVGSVRIPSGRLVVDSPWPDPWTDGAGRELAEPIPAGVHRVEAAWVEAPYEFMGEHADGRECAGTRLVVSDEPVAVWEMGVASGDDVEQLKKGDRLGFTTDTAMGSFADAESWQVLTEPFREFWQEPTHEPGTRKERRTEELGEGFERSSDESRGADLLAFPADEGLSVVWLGRTALGKIAVVAVTPRLDSLAADPHGEI